MLYLSESLQESTTTDDGEKPVSDTGENPSVAPLDQSQATLSDSAAREEEAGSGALLKPLSLSGCIDPASAELSVQKPTKLKKDRLARLKELGLEPPPVAKLCADNGGFVHLDPAQLNPGQFRCFLDINIKTG